MKKFFQSLLILAGCLHLTGGPLGMMQLYAWASMLISYSQESTLIEAAKDTFSGQKPCDLCLKIESAQADKADETSPPARLPQSPNFAALFADLVPPTPLGDLSAPTMPKSSDSYGASQQIPLVTAYLGILTPPPQG